MTEIQLKVEEAYSNHTEEGLLKSVHSALMSMCRFPACSLLKNQTITMRRTGQSLVLGMDIIHINGLLILALMLLSEPLFGQVDSVRREGHA